MGECNFTFESQAEFIRLEARKNRCLLCMESLIYNSQFLVLQSLFLKFHLKREKSVLKSR